MSSINIDNLSKDQLLQLQSAIDKRIKLIDAIDGLNRNGLFVSNYELEDLQTGYQIRQTKFIFPFIAKCWNKSGNNYDDCDLEIEGWDEDCDSDPLSELGFNIILKFLPPKPKFDDAMRYTSKDYGDWDDPIRLTYEAKLYCYHVNANGFGLLVVSDDWIESDDKNQKNDKEIGRYFLPCYYYSYQTDDGVRYHQFLLGEEYRENSRGLLELSINSNDSDELAIKDNNRKKICGIYYWDNQVRNEIPNNFLYIHQYNQNILINTQLIDR